MQSVPTACTDAAEANHSRLIVSMQLKQWQCTHKVAFHLFWQANELRTCTIGILPGTDSQYLSVGYLWPFRFFPKVKSSIRSFPLERIAQNGIGGLFHSAADSAGWNLAFWNATYVSPLQGLWFRFTDNSNLGLFGRFPSLPALCGDAVSMSVP